MSVAETTIRVERQGGYTVLQNHILRSSLSLKAKGLLCVILSLPEDWDYSVGGLATICGTGRDAIRSGLQELEQAGYLTREQAHGQGGKFGGNVYVIHDTPQAPAPLLENPATEAPLSGNPSTENPLPENPTEQNKDLQTNDRIYPPIVPPQGEARRPRRRQAKETADWKPERFEAFWTCYRTHCRGEARQAAIRAWDNLRPTDELIETMANALVRQLESAEWQRGIGIPYASTWLNGRRWEDTPKAPGGPAPTPPGDGEKQVFGWQ